MRVLVAIPLVAAGGIGTGVAIAAVLVELAGKPDAIADEAAPAPSRTIRQRAALSSRPGAGGRPARALGESLTRSDRATTFLSSMNIVDTKVGEGGGQARADPAH